MAQWKGSGLLLFASNYATELSYRFMRATESLSVPGKTRSVYQTEARSRRFMALAPSLGRAIRTASSRRRRNLIYLLQELPPTRHHRWSKSVSNQRDQSVFGEDVETFRPERWLQVDRSNSDRYYVRI
jgi:hypothetical protein